jgi:hypothetical protein
VSAQVGELVLLVGRLVVLKAGVREQLAELLEDELPELAETLNPDP